jgi:hypothetical protein
MTFFQTLTDIAGYLKQCRPRKLTTGDWSFEAHGIADRTRDIQEFFREHPEYQISINGAQRFTTLSNRALERLNGQLPESNQVIPSNPVIMANKYR